MRPYPWRLDELLTATGGQLAAGPQACAFGAIGIDSRTIGGGQLFVAIAGETHDGHTYVNEVLDKGVGAVMVAAGQLDRLPLVRMQTQGVACVAVDDTTIALGDLARFNRNRAPLKVVAITGSNGKTSTRMLTERVVGRQYEALGTQGNLNNHIGLPLTLLRLAPDQQAAVLELGMNHAGEISHLGSICEPDVGLITNVGPAHLEGLGSIENVARAKAELLATIRPGGTAIVNGDDPLVVAMANDFNGPVLIFGTGTQAQVKAEEITVSTQGIEFILSTPSGQIPVRLATPARVMVPNALAAAAVGQVLGIDLEKIKEGLEAFVPQQGRMGLRQPGGGIDLMDDTYNANPASMQAAIETLAAMGAGRRTIAVVGDMLELGDQAEALHRQVGRAAGQAGIDRLYAAGDYASAVVDGAASGGVAADHLFQGSKEQIIERLDQELARGDLILVKGSRGMAMEQVVEAICRWADGR